jgi:hypothetical protein
MSTANIVVGYPKWTGEGQCTIVFWVNHGRNTRQYFYSGATAIAIMAGTDPANVSADSDDGGGAGGTGLRNEEAFKRAKNALDEIVEAAGTSDSDLRKALGAFEKTVAELGEVTGSL